MTDVASLPGKWRTEAATARKVAETPKSTESGITLCVIAENMEQLANELESALAARSPAPSAGVEAFLVERLHGAGYGPARSIVDAAIYDATSPHFWISDEAKQRHRVTPLVPALSQHPAAPSMSPAVAGDARSCTCHPSDNPPIPCARKYAYSECVASSAPQGEAETLYLGMLWRHAAASQRNDEAAEDMWAERADEVFKGVSKDYQDGARWLAHCVSEWDKATPPPAPAAEQFCDGHCSALEHHPDCVRAAEQPQGEMVLVPREPTEEQCGGLARDIVMWWCFERRSGRNLFKHLKSAGREIPNWLRKEIPDIDHVPPKGAVAAAIYRAMLSAAPSRPVVDEVWSDLARDLVREIDANAEPFVSHKDDLLISAKELMTAALGQQGDGNGN